MGLLRSVWIKNIFFISLANLIFKRLGLRSRCVFKKAFQILLKMPQILFQHSSILLGLADDQRAFQNGDKMLGQTLSVYGSSGRILGPRFIQIPSEHLGPSTKVLSTLRPDFGIGIRKLLGEVSQQATVLASLFFVHLHGKI